MALATKGFGFTEEVSSSCLASSASAQDLQQPSIISAMPLRLLPTSPSFSDFIPGMRPGFLTIKAISSAGSPPMLKNSKPFSSTNFLNVPCVARRTRCPYVFLRTRPSARNGWTSPREPTTCMTTLSGGGASVDLPPRYEEVYDAVYASVGGDRGWSLREASWIRAS